ncbi:hypothetical protein F3Y22_tig00001750pilonHSYRG00008 [Hibiscus syriacus]|uniref:Uncharacterized protein n=1 Tax=Hibiscus syriacus TaxID=106335 RepID=A0A6A3CZ80_HIBSY|nr:hypothetical protein F3Y22_tig00001750pilonHSYRG00008 [Hibiscus syriacus]
MVGRDEEKHEVKGIGDSENELGIELGIALEHVEPNARSTRGKVICLNNANVTLRVGWLNVIREWLEDIVGNMSSRELMDTITKDLLGEQVAPSVVELTIERVNSFISYSEERSELEEFSHQVLARHGNKVSFDEPNSFDTEEDKVASVTYKYRKWKLDNDMQLVARCEGQSVVDDTSQKPFITLNALNEFDPKYFGVDWRQKFETQKGVVLSTDLNNNANKLTKWTAQVILANADLMRLGYVLRVHHRDHFNHVILGVVGYKPRDCAD